MGLPWPPIWEEGRVCGTCAVPLFSGRTPAFVYAQCVGITLCPLVHPDTPDPNRVVRLIQSIADECFWSGGYATPGWDYGYGLSFNIFGSHFRIIDVSGMRIFSADYVAHCRDHYDNQLVCGAPLWPGFSGGTVDCFW